MRDYVKVPPAQNGPTVGLVYGKPDNTQPPQFHTASNRSYAPIVDNYPEASGLLQGVSRTAQRFAGAMAVERGVEEIVEEHVHPHSSLGSPADHLRASDGPTGEFLRHETTGREWFDKIAARSRPSSGSAGPLPSRAGYQPALNDNLPAPRPRMYRGPEAISAQDALSAGPAGVQRSEPIQATYKRPEPLALGPGPSAPAEPTQRPQTRIQRRSGKQDETLSGIDWSKY
jgi:hypothetical protein